MEVLELKQQIHNAIDLETDTNRLNDIYDWMVAPHHILSESDKSQLIDMAENYQIYKQYSNEEVNTKIQKWKEK